MVLCKIQNFMCMSVKICYHLPAQNQNNIIEKRGDDKENIDDGPIIGGENEQRSWKILRP